MINSSDTFATGQPEFDSALQGQPRIAWLCIGAGGLPKIEVPFLNVTPQSVDGEHFRHRKIHGGPDQRLLIIARHSYKWLQENGFCVKPGSLGENVAIEGIDLSQIQSGFRLRLGVVLVEFTQRRIPCRALAPWNRHDQPISRVLYRKCAQPGDPTWGRGGLYAKVLTSGTIYADDKIELG
jgi:MOSC domain-containing protein YiiM